MPLLNQPTSDSQLGLDVRQPLEECLCLPCPVGVRQIIVCHPLFLFGDHIGKQMKQAILGHIRRDNDKTPWERGCHMMACEDRLLFKRRELGLQLGMICSNGLLRFFILLDFQRGRPLAARKV